MQLRQEPKKNPLLSSFPFLKKKKNNQTCTYTLFFLYNQMGTSLSLLFWSRKRSRETRDDEGGSTAVSSDDVIDARAHSVDAFPPSSSFADHLRSLRYCCTCLGTAGTVVCRHVADDVATQQTYGCHAHLYETLTAGESHGVALAWCVDSAAPISTLSLLSLCRVANSCRKKTLLTSPKGNALILTYTATL